MKRASPQSVLHHRACAATARALPARTSPMRSLLQCMLRQGSRRKSTSPARAQGPSARQAIGTATQRPASSGGVEQSTQEESSASTSSSIRRTAPHEKSHVSWSTAPAVLPDGSAYTARASSSHGSATPLDNATLLAAASPSTLLHPTCLPSSELHQHRVAYAR